MSTPPTDEHPIIVGIDLGTTNSLVAWCDQAGPRILTDSQGRGSLPSVVRYDDHGKVTAIGEPARDHAVEFPTTTLFSIKRLMGRGMADVQNELDYLPYAVVGGDHDTARVQVTADKRVSPQEVSAIILRELKKVAEVALGKSVQKAVVTVPAYFDDAQRQATRDAGRIAGLEVVRIVNEPTAAALAYGMGPRNPTLGESGIGESDSQKTDTLPANTTAKPLAQLNEAGTVSLNTKFNTQACTTGSGANPDDTGELDEQNSVVAVFDLGGGTFDISILHLQQTEQGTVDQVIATSGDTHLGGDDVDRMIVELIQKEIGEQLGQALDFPPSTRQAFRSLAEAAKVRLSNEPTAQLEIDLGNGKQYQRTLTRVELEAMMLPWVSRAMDCCKQALKQADMAVADIDRVIMVGGSTRIPLVRQKVGELFDTVPYTALNPDEVVALGAAVQGSILAGINREMLLLDVIPLSLGIETLGGAVAKLVMSNTTIPAKATDMFTTHVEGQTHVKIHILQGERELVKDCRSLGEFDLTGIPPMPAGLPKIDVTFLVDANGVLNVSAVERRSEKAARVQIIPNHGLTRQEVDRMEAESMTHAREDMTAHQIIDLRNQATLDIRSIDRQIAKVGSEMDEAYRKEIQDKVAIVKAFIAEENPDANTFHIALDAMDKATIRLAELAIKQTLQQEQE